MEATRAQTLGVETTVFQAVAQAYLDQAVVRDQTLVEGSPATTKQVLHKQLDATRDRVPRSAK